MNDTPDRGLWVLLLGDLDPEYTEREDSRKAKVDALCDRLELEMMGIKP